MMDDETLEARIRADLRRAAARDIPAVIAERAASIPHTAPAPEGRSQWRLAGRISIGAVGVATAIVLAVITVWRPWDTGPAWDTGPGSGPANPVTVASAFGTLSASDFELSVDGAVWLIPNPTDEGVRISSFEGSPTFGQFTLVQEYARPTSMANLTNEGIAIGPESSCVNGLKPFLWTDDAASGGHSLRSDFIPCGAFIPCKLIAAGRAFALGTLYLGLGRAFVASALVLAEFCIALLTAAG